MKGRGWIKIGIFVLVVGGAGLALKLSGIELRDFSPQRISEFVQSFGVWAPAVYLIAYGQPIVPLPASIMTLVAGIAFGNLGGFLAALCGATLRAALEFLVARLLGREAVAKLLKGKIADLDAKIGANGFQAVLLIRLIPNFPFDIQNYGLGFSRVKFIPYVLATFLGMIPGCFAFVYLGSSLTDPKNLWKLILAILLIIGLMVAQSAWKKRHPATVPAPPQP
ncbi:MAG: TVP38/TMEM64 family protein [Candidatus Omnitrophica bacterium CG11_big_fil_rev_8_21_14_0_20_63_9]|nr:MAG: TVP38/TMEM64 family protein [Candidatus Omnitrophica bacterium CG11_big_fil_rev_8_21_14_0_20_63_9]